MIQRWRQQFDTPTLPFFYVELCSEYGAEEPKEAGENIGHPQRTNIARSSDENAPRDRGSLADFWLAQRSALALPFTGFATTTDIQRALHPPDKQVDVFPPSRYSIYR
jgi:hypothetical protein|eukprot:SAG25_NODE_5232_length_684_cov_1.454701_2_plen_108_part_00